MKSSCTLTGVHGRVSELVKVTQKSYNLALAVVMGSNVDSVVVDTERAAKECVAYLKQRRIPPMTFIPLQTIKVKPPNERLRDNLRGIANLAFDLLEFDAKLENAFIYVCGCAAHSRVWWRRSCQCSPIQRGLHALVFWQP